MGRYTNCKCDYCQKIFTDADDVVICPICGAPQHRSCYMEHHGCAHESEHASGYEWKRTQERSGASDAFACARCGAQNPAGADRCQICGAPLGEGAAPGQQPQGDPYDGGENENASRSYTRTTGEARLPDFEVDGVSSREISDYLGPAAAASFLPKFNILLQQRGSLGAWNIPALIFGPFYFFYRRINKIGLLLVGILALIYVPGVIYSLEYFKAFYAPEYFGLTLAYSQKLLDLFGPIASVASYLRLALHIYCCTQANAFFLDRVIADIREMHTRYPQTERGGDYRTALFYRGRPATLTAVLAAAAFFGTLYAVICIQLIPLLAG